MKLQLILLLCVVLVGCAQITPYRTELKPENRTCVANAPTDCPNDALFLVQTPSSGPDGGIPIGIIEFDDQGALQSREFKDKIMRRIDELTNDHGTLTVVFAHGWLNNAAPQNHNLARFQELLKRTAIADKDICQNRSCAGRKVVGIYLAWRGVSATIQPFKSMSFWNRKKRAHRVGQDGATEILTELSKIKAGSSGNRGISRLILIGHSFGGALVYSATQSLLMRDTEYVQAKGKSVPRTTADLVVLVNPAFEAARFTSLHEKATGLSFPKTQSPILAIFTSESDNATKTAFPAGRLLSTLLTKYNPNRPGQAKLDRTAIGHYAGYQTHALRLKDGGASPATRVESVCEWERFREGKTDAWDLKRVVLERKDLVKIQPQQMNPYYNVVVDDAIISGHSGIWDPVYFMEFISRFVTVQEARSCAYYRTGVDDRSDRSRVMDGSPQD